MDAQTKMIMEDIAEDAARKAVEQMLVRFGIDGSNPIEIQKDMACLREVRLLVYDPEVRKDMEYIRTIRLGIAKVKEKSMLTAVAALTVFILGALWVGFKAKLPL